MSIEASLPGLYKKASLLAVRNHDESARPNCYLLAVGGAGTLLAEVIGRYLAVAEQMDEIPASSLAITPANYKFHFAGEVRTGGTPAFIYRITPKRNDAALLKGQLWTDLAATLLHQSEARLGELWRPGRHVLGVVSGHLDSGVHLTRSERLTQPVRLRLPRSH